MSYNSKYTGEEIESAIGKVELLNVAAVDANEEVEEPDVTYLTTAEQTLTEEQKAQVKENLGISAEDIDLSGYAKTDDIPTKVSQLENDVPYALKSDVEIVVNVENGVYIMTATGELVAPTTTDNTALGVVLITDNQRILISKEDATNGTDATLCWGKNLFQKDVAGITEATDKSVAQTDFNGKTNTDAIIAAYGQHNVDMDSRDMCKVLASYTEGGFTDWYVPAAGQLYEMYNKKSDINTALQNIGGTAFNESDYYWSSSESNVSHAWIVYFEFDYVNDSFKDNYRRVRFVRDISTITPLKDKVFELESSKQDLLISGTNIKTINGQSLLGEGDIQIEAGGSEVPIVDHGTGDTTFVLTPNILHKWGTVTSLTLTLAVPTDTTIANYYMVQFTCGSSATSINLPDTIKWITEPNIEANKTYQISILDNLGVIGGA